MYNMTELPCCMLYMKAVKRINPKKPHHKEKKFYFLYLYAYEMMTVH